MNLVVLIGRFTRKPELEYTAGGTAVTKFTIAVDRRKKGEADFIRITAYDKQAENICRYMDKGRQIAISGRIQTSSYEKDGKKYFVTDIISENAKFIGRNNDTEQRDNQSYHNYGGYSEPPQDYRRYKDDIF